MHNVLLVLGLLTTLACLVVPELPRHAGGLAFQPCGRDNWGRQPWKTPIRGIDATSHPPWDPPYAPQNYPRLSSNKSMRGFQSRLDGSRQLPYTRLVVNGHGMLVNPALDTGSYCPPQSVCVRTSNSRFIIYLLAVLRCVSVSSLGWRSTILDEAIEVLVNMPSKVRQQGGHQSFACCVAVTYPGTGTTQRVSHDDAEKHDDAFDCSPRAGCSLGTVAFLLS